MHHQRDMTRSMEETERDLLGVPTEGADEGVVGVVQVDEAEETPIAHPIHPSRGLGATCVGNQGTDVRSALTCNVTGASNSVTWPMFARVNERQGRREAR